MKGSERTSLGEQLSKKMSARISLLMAAITTGIFFISYLLSMQMFNQQVKLWTTVAPQNALTSLMDSDYFSIDKEMKFLESTKLFSSFLITDNQKRVVSKFGADDFNDSQLIPISDEAKSIWGYYAFTKDFYKFFSPFLISAVFFSILVLLLYFIIRWRIRSDLELEFLRFNQFLEEIELITEKIGEIYDAKENQLIVDIKPSRSVEQEIINRAVSKLLDEIRKANKSLREAVAASEQKRFQEELTRTALQVAHDIGSPLAVLETIVQSTSLGLPEESRISVRNASSRIRDIANSLLKKAKQEILCVNEGIFMQQHLYSLVSLVVKEKRLQYKSSPCLDIIFNFNDVSYQLFAFLKVSDFSRMLSNIINNSVESLDNGGSISVSLSKSKNYAVIVISDFGRGMPKEILSKLGSFGVTYGKSNGLGLGLYHAKNTIEAWNGTLEVQSQLGKGTTVKLSLPEVQPPSWFVSEINLADKQQIMIIDDDESIHDVWKIRFKKLEIEMNKQIILKHFYSPVELRKWHDSANPSYSSMLYLCDYEFIGSNENGIDLITNLKLNYLSILVTSRFVSEEITLKCEASGIKLLPKEMASIVTIR